MSTANVHGLRLMAHVEKPLKFIHLKGIEFGEFGISYHVNDGFVINDLSRVSAKEQLLFQKMVSRQQQLNLMVMDSVFPLMMAEMANVILMKGPMTFQQYVRTGISAYGEFLMEHKLKQLIHHLLYADIAAAKPFNGELDYEKVYYLNNEKGEIEYFPVFEQRQLQTLLYHQAIMEIDFAKSRLTGAEAMLVLQTRF